MTDLAACLCCGRRVVDPNPRQPLHLDCWTEHHSDPTGVWPPDHRCQLGSERTPTTCACRRPQRGIGEHEHRSGYTEDCALLDCTCPGVDRTEAAS